MTDKFITALEGHYAENVLVTVFLMTVGLLVYFNHTHNDELGRWATTAAGNVLSALFGMLVGKKTDGAPAPKQGRPDTFVGPSETPALPSLSQDIR